MTVKKHLLLAAAILSGSLLYAQDKLPIKFGKVTDADFAAKPFGNDSAADVVVIADYGATTFEASTHGWFSLVFKHSMRMKIVRRGGFEAANVSIPIWTEGQDYEKLDGLRAVTYNMENGKVIETKLEDKAIYTDKLSKQITLKKFTFPALKEGSVLEYTYTLRSPFLYHLQPWSFQGQYPVLWSEYNVETPSIFQYVTLGQGFVPFAVNTTDSRTENFTLVFPGGAEKDDRETFNDNLQIHRWVMKNVPALKEEPFTTSIDNYTSKIEFQLARYVFPNGHTEDQMGNWTSRTAGMLKSEWFGADLNKSNSWMDDEVKTITGGAATSLEKAKAIYSYFRDNFTCTSSSGLYLDDDIKTVYKNKHGNVAELNLLLTAFLRHIKLDADPVILSTRSNGFASPVYPLISRFNYVITRLNVDSTVYLLDASNPCLGFGHLASKCYNGYARVISQTNFGAMFLEADSLKESKATLAFFSKDPKGGLTGHIQSTPGGMESIHIRETVKEHGKEEFSKKIQQAYTGEETFINLELDSLKKPEEPLGVEYDLRVIPDSTSDLFYFNPMQGEAYKENPFKAAERVYPVEMPYSVDERYVLNMEIPDGYVVDELPKSAKVSYNADEGYFEYLTANDGQTIQFQCRLRLNKANFKPEDYDSLREFFGLVVKKQSEQIVFKKKK